MAATLPVHAGAPVNHLSRSRTDRRLTGVAGGIAEHEGLDPDYVRTMFVLLTVVGGLGAIVYAVLWVTMPPAR